jgi:hypothetical protein
MKTPRPLVLLSALILCTACSGYRLGNISGKEIQGVRSVYVPVAKNDSYSPELSVTVTNAILRRFDNDGTLQTSQLTGSDSQLDVVIKKVDRQPSRSVRRDATSSTGGTITQANVLATAQYDLFIEAEVTYLNRKLGKNILEKQKVTGRTNYFVGNDQTEAERQALPQAAEDLAKNVVSLITEGW